MTTYIVRRLLQAIPLLLIITAVVFVLIQLTGDPLAAYGRGRVRAEDRARLRHQLGLDQPVLPAITLDENRQITVVPGQYLTWLGRVASFDWGESIVTKQPVLEMIGNRLRNTLILMGAAYVITLAASLLLGVYSAARQYSFFDNLLTTASFIGYSFPIFTLALLLLYLFAVNFKAWGLPYFPTGGMYDLEAGPTIPQYLWHLVLPVAALSIIDIAGYTRFLRSSMLEVLSQDYVRTARAKGVMERIILLRHALKNAALPFVTLLGLNLPFALAGAIVTETIFAWPGMGRLFWEHVQKSDYPVVMGILLVVSVAVVLFQIITDVTYTFLDPRIRLT